MMFTDMSYTKSRVALLSELERVCVACDTTLAEVDASDDYDVATPSQVVAVCLQYERDQRDQAMEELGRLRAEVERLQGWLKHIEGGDHPCLDESQLRQWAYEAVTLRHDLPE